MTRRDLLLTGAVAMLPFAARAAAPLDVRALGARGDGVTLDTDAFNRAIVEAARAGGGTVVIPKGRYLCFSVRLRSNVALVFEPGAVIEAADPARHQGRYDLPEDRGDILYQDFGHSHWANSLFWGDGVERVSISGPGLIDGRGLTRNGPGARWHKTTGERPLSMKGMDDHAITRLEPDAAAMNGQGNKAISLRGGGRVRLSGFTILRGGHMAILATGTAGIEIDDLRIDTQRDGIDLDCVTGARVRGCRVNSPNDDAIVVKSSLALGHLKPSQDVVISDCTVSGYDIGTMLDGTRGTTQALAPDRDRPTGRIKLGTESNGGYSQILIERCRFEHCRGLALETVDGGAMRDVTVRDIVMRDITTAPIFVRIGDRRRGPEGTGIGSTAGVRLSDIDATGIDHRYPAILAGLPGHPVADVSLERIHLGFAGGGTAADAALRPAEVVDAYPEPSMFGTLPAWGLWMRHARDIRIRGLEMTTATPDARPPVMTEDAERIAVADTPLWHNRIDQKGRVS
ncbi:rhamnogalacturonidase [Sphingomonas sp. PR090111-T3T-6A]|uniref:rhamnogalacturonidase n=1 Tax=Sphingomonas sp. PR090111-T3T-6A TaxID=685778 RepID=UPI000380F62F|nr:glycosyl hydrolase family 28-related protein [Sphingomonas sp. PR090111-T3T-6A]